ncbi:MAG: hypothetical protein ACKO2G_09835 [Verrucomicrobiales bacterium]
MKPWLIAGIIAALAGGFAAGWFARGIGTAEKNPPPEKPAVSSATTDSTLSMVDSIMRSGGNEIDMPFPKVIEVGTGHRLLPMMANDPVHAALVDLIAASLNAILSEMNAEHSPVSGLRRINEASAFFEEGLRRRIDEHPDFECGFPHSATGKVQRSGYPDLRIFHPVSGKVFYLDPKLYERASRESTLRTFYFTSDPGTSKVGEDAAHLLVGIYHDGADGHWKFLGWDLVDLSYLNVKLKAEFQASNRDLYDEKLILRSSSTKSPAPSQEP